MLHPLLCTRVANLTIGLKHAEDRGRCMVCKQAKNHTKYSFHTLVNFFCFFQEGVYRAEQQKYIYIYIHLKILPSSLHSHKLHRTVSLAVQFKPLLEFSITLRLLAYAIIMWCMVKGKQLNRWGYSVLVDVIDL